MTKIIDDSVLERLQLEVGAENIPMIIEMFCVDSSNRAQLIVTALQDDDIKTLAAQCHALKGGAFSVGAETLATVVQRAELACKADDLATVKYHLADFEALFETTHRTYLARIET